MSNKKIILVNHLLEPPNQISGMRSQRLGRSLIFQLRATLILKEIL
jgi:hypothetical protein